VQNMRGLRTQNIGFRGGGGEKERESNGNEHLGVVRLLNINLVPPPLHIQ
jgi:hypothetical protein